MGLAEAGATIQLCLVDCCYDSTSARGCRGSEALWDDMRQSRKSQINVFPPKFWKRYKNKALESETARRKKIKRRRIKQFFKITKII